jgi:poly [ADP-ribose] polymerase
MNGLIVPPHNAGHVTGRMFGNGIYSASASTKALNYSTSFWSNRHTSKYNSIFLFITKFGMGNIKHASQAMPSGPGRGYDSVWAHKRDAQYPRGTLQNDEFIVYDVSQADVTHLLEIRS